jgi:hypothetical protein
MAQSGAFARVIPVETIPSGGRSIRLEAPCEALPSIAARLGVPEVKALLGAFELTRNSDGVDLAGRLDATLVRECGASLELFEERVAEPFVLRFARAAPAGAELDLNEDSPEPLEDEAIDLAEVLIQQLSLAMDPWPRRPGAVVRTREFGSAGASSPFAGLDRLIAKKGDQE